MIQTLSKLRIEGNGLNLIKNIYKHLQIKTSINTYGEKPGASP